MSTTYTPATKKRGENWILKNYVLRPNGTVPSTAQSLEFEAVTVGTFSVSFAGNELEPIAISSVQGADGMTYTLYGASISAWAGQTGALEFTADFDVHDPYFVLDDISFSPQTVPEPSPLALTGAGALLFALYRRFASKRE
jgi:hypothetical protein